jgi:Zn-dependent protease
MAFTAADVKNLREMTGCGMMDCKKALVETDGDMDKAVEWLREKGLAASQKKAGRIAAEGMAYAEVIDGVGVVVEVNSETDFVAKNEKFVDFVKGVAATVAKCDPKDLEALMACKYAGTDLTVEQQQQEMVLVIGENIKVRRFAVGAALLRVAAVFLCLTIHETCHGLAAYALGDPTAKQMHRLSLNPLRHIDWFGLLMMFVCGFGWAKPVPVDMRYFKKPKQGMAITALAGPVSNFLLALLLLFCSKLIYLYAAYSTVSKVAYQFLVTTSMLSVGLGLFNLIPIPPLDGSKVLAVVLPDRTYYQLMRWERYGMILLLVLSFTNVGGNFISSAISVVWKGLYSIVY